MIPDDFTDFYFLFLLLFFRCSLSLFFCGIQQRKKKGTISVVLSAIPLGMKKEMREGEA